MAGREDFEADFGDDDTVAQRFDEVLCAQLGRVPGVETFDALWCHAVAAYETAFGEDDLLPNAATCWRDRGFCNVCDLTPPAGAEGDTAGFATADCGSAARPTFQERLDMHGQAEFEAAAAEMSAGERDDLERNVTLFAPRNLIDGLRSHGLIAVPLPRFSRLHVSYRDGADATMAVIVMDGEEA